jgi:hypothetical protein
VVFWSICPPVVPILPITTRSVIPPPRPSRSVSFVIPCVIIDDADRGSVIFTPDVVRKVADLDNRVEESPRGAVLDVGLSVSAVQKFGTICGVFVEAVDTIRTTDPPCAVTQLVRPRAFGVAVKIQLPVDVLLYKLLVLSVEARGFVGEVADVLVDVEESPWGTVHQVLNPAHTIDEFRAVGVVGDQAGERARTPDLLHPPGAPLPLQDRLSRAADAVHLVRIVALESLGVEERPRGAVLHVPSPLPAVEELVARSFVHELAGGVAGARSVHFHFRGAFLFVVDDNSPRGVVVFAESGTVEDVHLGQALAEGSVTISMGVVHRVRPFGRVVGVTARVIARVGVDFAIVVMHLDLRRLPVRHSFDSGSVDYRLLSLLVWYVNLEGSL